MLDANLLKALSMSMAAHMRLLLAELNLHRFPEALALQKPDQDIAELLQTGRVWLDSIRRGNQPNHASYIALYGQCVEKLTRRMPQDIAWQAHVINWLDTITFDRAQLDRGAREDLDRLLEEVGLEATTDQVDQWFAGRDRCCMTFRILLQGLKHNSLIEYMADRAAQFPYDVKTYSRKLITESQQRGNNVKFLGHYMRVVLQALTAQSAPQQRRGHFPAVQPYSRLARSLLAELPKYHKIT